MAQIRLKSALSVTSRIITGFSTTVTFFALCLLALQPAFAESHDRYALLVGVGDNIAPKNVLFGASNDTAAISSLLQGKYKFPATNIKLILDKEATRSGILQGFEWLIARAKPGDTVVFYYSGHGVHLPKPTPDGVPGEEDGAICPYDALKREQLIFGYEIGQRIDRMKTDHVTVIIDACHSGNSSRGLIGGRSRAIPPSFFQNTASAKPAAIARDISGFSGTARAHPERYIGAARSDQKAHEDAFLPAPRGVSEEELLKKSTMGALTFYLVNLLRADTENRLTYADLVRRVRVPLREKYGNPSNSEESVEPQEPQVLGPGVETARFLEEIVSEDTSRETGRAASAIVDTVTDKMVTVHAVAGSVLTPGSLFRSNGTKEWIETDDSSGSSGQALLQIAAVSGLTATAKPIRGMVRPGMTLFELVHGKPEDPLRVGLTDTGKALLPLLKKIPFVSLTSLNAGVDVTLDKPSPNTITPYLAGNALPTITLASLEATMNRLQAAKQVIALQNTSNQAIPITVEANATGGFQTAHIDDKVSYEIKTEPGTYITILDVAADGRITGIADTPSENGQPIRFPATVSGPAGIDTLKVFVTRKPLGITLPKTREASLNNGTDPTTIARDLVARITHLINQGNTDADLAAEGAVVTDGSWGSADLRLRILP